MRIFNSDTRQISYNILSNFFLHPIKLDFTFLNILDQFRNFFRKTLVLPLFSVQKFWKFVRKYKKKFDGVHEETSIFKAIICCWAQCIKA